MDDGKVSVLLPFQTSANFCNACGMLLRLESARGTVECKFCHSVTDLRGKCDAGNSDPL